MTEPTGGPAATDTEGWSAGNEVESLQGAARWLVGASAAVGAALLAGTQVSALTRLTPDNPVQLAIAITACIISLVAVGVILVRATRVLVHPDWTLNKLAHQDFDKKRRKKHKHLYDELESQFMRRHTVMRRPERVMRR